MIRRQLRRMDGWGALRRLVVVLMAAGLAAGCGRSPSGPAGPGSQPAKTSCQFKLGDESFTNAVCRFQFLPADPEQQRPKTIVQIENFDISPATYPSLQLIAQVDVAGPDKLALMTVGAKAIVRRSASADPLASRTDVTITFTESAAPFLIGTFEGTVQPAGSDKTIAVSGEFRARPL